MADEWDEVDENWAEATKSSAAAAATAGGAAAAAAVAEIPDVRMTSINTRATTLLPLIANYSQPLSHQHQRSFHTCPTPHHTTEPHHPFQDGMWPVIVASLMAASALMYFLLSQPVASTAPAATGAQKSKQQAPSK